MKASTKLTGAFLCAALGLSTFIGLENISSKPLPLGNLEIISNSLNTSTGQVPVMAGQDDLGRTVVIFAAPPGTKSADGAEDPWTIVVINDLAKPQGYISVTGSHFQPVTNLKQRFIPGAVSVSYPESDDDQGFENSSRFGCAPHAMVVKIMEEKFGLVRQAYGVADDMEVFEVFGVTPGTKDATGKDVTADFSILATNETGETCTVHMGDNFIVAPGLREKYPRALTPGG